MPKVTGTTGKGVRVNGIADRISTELLDVLASSGITRTYIPDETVIREGEASDTLYVLISGRLKAFTEDARGRELTYSSIEPGEIFGEMFLDGEPRSASVKALTFSECAVITGSRVSILIRQNPDFTQALIIKLISRVRHTTRKLRSLAFDGVYERTVALLNSAAIHDGELRRVPRQLTQQEIANQVGASREMVNHVLRDLIRGGFITREPRLGMKIAMKLPEHW